MKKILVLNGANLNMLGKRNPTIYGSLTLKELNLLIIAKYKDDDIIIKFAQTNYEGKIIDILAKEKYDGYILNAGAYTHYSYSIRDCIEGIAKPVIEVHLSNILLREEFRKTRVFADVVAGCFMGEGIKSYFDAIDYLIKELL